MPRRFLQWARDWIAWFADYGLKDAAQLPADIAYTFWRDVLRGDGFYR